VLRVKLTEGASYRVLAAGARLSGWETVSQTGGAFYERGTGRKLAVGDVVTLSRFGYSGGSDGITVPFFKLADGSFEGQFWPSSMGGSPKAGMLEPVEAAKLKTSNRGAKKP
jgi:hypothetical protein